MKLRHLAAIAALSIALALASPGSAAQAAVRVGPADPDHDPGAAHAIDARPRSSKAMSPGRSPIRPGSSVPASLALRGITRRTAEICDFAPLTVDFTGSPPAGSLFEGQNKLKLVTHCRKPRPASSRRCCSNMPPTGCTMLLTPLSFAGAARDHRLCRRNRPADHLAGRLLHRGCARCRAPATIWPKCAPASASRSPG